MNDLKDTPTADLIAEWGKYPDTLSKNRPTWAKNCRQALAAELDRRCETVGFWINGGKIWFDPEKLFGYEDPESGIITCVEPFASAAELHALLGWLLLKEGGKG